jgi:4-amino-4-deoxy-L-arabinose transferase-like glycosyltransferase
VIDRWPPLAWAALAACLAFLLRLPYVTVPLTADEGGYAEVARLWSRGAALYDRVDGIWVDRPQGLLWIFRALEHVDGGSTAALRIAAALVAAAVVVVTFLITERTAGRIPAVLAALLLAVFGSAPRIEAFTLSGELLASLPSALALLAFIAYLRRGGWWWLAACGLLTGAAVMIKQSGFDGGLAAVAFLLWTRRRRGLLPAAAIVGFAFVPVIWGALSAASFDDWWYAMVTYRSQGDSLFSGSPVTRADLFKDSFPAVAISIGVLVALAAIGWRRGPLLLRLWVAAAALSVLGGGNFHPHYYLQLCAPLAALGGVGAPRLLTERRRWTLAVTGILAALAVASVAGLWVESRQERILSLFPEDPHLLHSNHLVGWLTDNTQPGDKVFVLWAGADINYLADRRPAVPYLWYRNIQAIPGALDQVRDSMASPDGPRYIVGLHKPHKLDKSGKTYKLLMENFHRVGKVDGIVIYERN